MENIDVKGIDFGFGGNPGGKNIRAAGFEFVAHYLSLNPAKSYTKDEIQDYKANGLSLVFVWETTTRRSLGGLQAGIDDANRAIQELEDLGEAGWFRKPVIYFACDDDFQEEDLDQIEAYFNGVASVLPETHIGIYGGLEVVRDIMGKGYANYGWQTSAWSHEEWYPNAQLRQISYNTVINGVQCDVNQAMTSDFGQS